MGFRGEMGRQGVWTSGLLLAACLTCCESSCMIQPDESGHVVFPRLSDVPGYAFFRCTALRSVFLPDTVTAIRSNAFAYCSGLVHLDFIPDSVTTIEIEAFNWCTNLQTVTMPRSMTSLLSDVFSGTVSLTQLTYHAGTFMNYENFPSCIGWGIDTGQTPAANSSGVVTTPCLPCVNVTNMTFPDTVTGIRAGMFIGCQHLKSITIPPSTGSGGVRYGDNFLPCIGFGLQTGVTTAAKGGQPCIPCAGQQHLDIWADQPGFGSVIGLGKYVFVDCEDVVTMSLPDTLKTIDDSAFAGAINLQSIVIPDSVIAINSAAFAGCYSLQFVTLPRFPGSWISDAFTSCLGLGLTLTDALAPPSSMPMNITCLPCIVNLTIPGKVSAIGDSDYNRVGAAYTFCPTVRRLVIPNSVSLIGTYAFAGCANLANVTVPQLGILTYIGEAAFASTAVTNLELPRLVRSLPPFAFSNCQALTTATLQSAAVTALLAGAFFNSGLISVQFGQYLHFLDNSSFAWNQQLQSVTMNKVTMIGAGAFQGCTQLTTLRLPDSLLVVASEAFGLSGLRTISIPKSVTSIAPTAFADLGCNVSLFVAGADVCNCTRCVSLPPTSAAPISHAPTSMAPTSQHPTAAPTSLCLGNHKVCDLETTQCGIHALCVCRPGLSNLKLSKDGTYKCSGTQQGLSPTLVAGIVLSCVTAFTVMICGVYMLQKRRGLERVRLTEVQLQSSEARVRVLQRAWEIPADDIILGAFIAQGAYGSVRKGRWGHQAVAVKILNRPINEEDDPEGAETFRKECVTLQAIKNPFLLVFLGAGTFADGRAYMVTEFMPKGSLRASLRNPDVDMVWGLRMRIALEVAMGVRHLHRIGIVHRDLKSDNVLLSEDSHAKVADFGTSRFVAEYEYDLDRTATDNPSFSPVSSATMTRAVGTQLWMAPEVFFGATTYGPEVDTYSFGIIMYELCSRKLPWTELSADSVLDLFGKLDLALRAGDRPTVPPEAEETQPKFVALMRDCWVTEPFDRPAFDAIAERIQAMRQTSSTQELESAWLNVPMPRARVSDPDMAPQNAPRVRVYEDELEPEFTHTNIAFTVT